MNYIITSILVTFWGIVRVVAPSPVAKIYIEHTSRPHVITVDVAHPTQNIIVK